MVEQPIQLRRWALKATDRDCEEILGIHLPSKDHLSSEARERQLLGGG
jgi:hypothetical protein